MNILHFLPELMPVGGVLAGDPSGTLPQAIRNPVLFRLAWMAFYFFLAYVIARIGQRLIPPLVESRARMSRSRRFTERRIVTLKGLVSDLFVGFLYLLAVIFSLGLFVNSSGLLTFLGLFSAALGLGFRPLVSDYLSGFIFLFEDQYSIGEKVEIFGVEGTVESIELRTTRLRAPSGELFIVPNGEIRNVRNFARGTFSLGTIQVDMPTSQLEKATEVLNRAVLLAPDEIPDLISPPEIISEDGVLGAKTRFTLVAKANYSKGATVRRQLLQFIHDALSAEGLDPLA